MCSSRATVAKPAPQQSGLIQRQPPAEVVKSSPFRMGSATIAAHLLGGTDQQGSCPAPMEKGTGPAAGILA